MKVTILGCGGSRGVPMADGTPGGQWGVCDPSNPRNRRRRVSILVEQGDTAVLVDASPDLRDQLLDSRVDHLDAVLFTHAHADHCHGLDELRALSWRRQSLLPAYMNGETREALTRRFDYAFTSSRPPNKFYPAVMDDIVFDGPFDIGPIRVVPFVQGHGTGATSMGFRLNDVAYSTDVNSLDEAAFAALAGVRLWIVDCLREEPHPTHSHLAQSLAWIARVGPERGLLTHINHEADYETLRRLCPPGVEPAYDGLVVEL